jgi:hypothetical protein
MLMSELVFKRPCGRCPAIGEVPISFEDIKAGKDPSQDQSRRMQVAIGGNMMVDYEFLCDACLEICSRHVLSIGKELEKRSSSRERKPAAPKEA